MSELFNSLVNNKKITYSALAALVFLGVSLPQTYQQTNKLTHLVKSVEFNTITMDGECPTPGGKFLHTGVFFVILYFLMKFLNNGDLTDGLIAKYSFYSTLIFFLLTSNDTYYMTSSLPGLGDLTNNSGCPTRKGVFIHALVFLVVLTLVMYFPKDQ